MSRGIIRKAWNSVSGWERSHFGGFKRMIFDYPYIQVDFNAKIGTPRKLASELQVFNAEKLIKIYLMKAKEHSAAMVALLEGATVTESTDPFTGRPVKVQRMSLNHLGVFEYIRDREPEFAPLFENYREQIFDSYIEAELPEGNEGEGEGQGEGEEGDQGQGEGEDNESKDGNSEKESEDSQGKTIKQKGGWGRGGKSLLEIIDEMKEFKPFSSWKIGDEVPVRWLDRPRRYGKSEYTENRPFTEEEKVNGDRLVKMLDISFEPKSDIVRSLRTGRLDTSKIAEVPAGNTAIYRQTLEDQDTKPFAVCILADMSGSMDGAKLHSQYTVLNSLYYGLSQIVPVNDLYIYAHTGDDQADIYTLCSPYKPDYEKNIGMYYDIETDCNYDGTVIEEVHKKIRAITDNPVLMITLSDGQPCDSMDNMKKILEKARRDQFIAMGVGIAAPHVKELYTYHCLVDDLGTFVNDVSQLVNKVVRAEFK